jgi:3-methyladenine DNA glycosylase AlkC
MTSLEQRVYAQVGAVQHGFKEMKLMADQLVSELKTPDALYKAARELYDSPSYQVRMTAVFVFGAIALRKPEALAFLRETVSGDSSWQVQEILAQAFNQFCAENGYEQSLPIITSWVEDFRPNVRRAASEGLRIWNYKPYFKEHPEQALQLLASLKADESEYVRKSAGNAIRDISRKEKALVSQELKRWDITKPRIKQTYELAAKFLGEK